MTPPVFPSLQALLAVRSSPAFWRPLITEAFDRHSLGRPGTLTAGHNATHPTFLTDGLVIKLFGGAPFWRRSHAAEHAAQQRVSEAADPRVPGLVASGRLFDDPEAPWPYLITTRIHGVPWFAADLSVAERHVVAADLGALLARVRALPVDGLATPESWAAPTIDAALQHSAFPEALRGEVAAFLAALPPPVPVMVHGDIVDNHVLVAGGRLAGLIDWGDAMAADPHIELGKLTLHTFGGDRSLLGTFLAAGNFPVGPDFAQRVLGHTLHRQAIGLAQHHSFDVFNHLPRLLAGRSVGSLAALAGHLFAPLRDTRAQ